MFQFKDFGSLKALGGVDCNQLIGKLPFQCRFIFNVIQILCHVNVFIMFTDLIGRVVSIHQPKDIQVKQNSQRLIDFVIEDCRESRLTVTLWDEHVDSVLPFLNGALTDPLIVILQLCRARVTDDSEIRISSSYTATRVLFNYECPEVLDSNTDYKLKILKHGIHIVGNYVK
nr:replication protein A 70 kDa DNA-binding subunit B-like [Ipomoea batatas]